MWRGSIAAAVIGYQMIGAGAWAADGSSPIIVSGLIEGRFVGTDGPRTWEHRGLGKTRFGGDGGWRGVGHVEGALTAVVHLNWDWKFLANVSVDPGRDRNPVDLVEGFVQYKPAPTQRTRINARLGAFFPPVSFENTGIAWTSPYTLTSSAINAWIGEELRTIGAEVSFVHTFDDGEVRARGALFAANDPAGVLLAWRGWAITDREAGVFERLPLAPLRVISGAGPVPQQAPWVKLGGEIDDRPGVYGSFEASLMDIGEAGVVLYDNRARDTAFDGFQYAWHTRFMAFGGHARLSEDTDLIVQAILGDTTMGTATPGRPLVDVEFTSAFILLSRAWDRHRLSARAEYFETTDKDLTVADDNGEHGVALTAAYIFRPVQRHRLTLELLQAVSYRTERIYLGRPRKARETQVQASYRIFF